MTTFCSFGSSDSRPFNYNPESQVGFDSGVGLLLYCSLVLIMVRLKFATWTYFNLKPSLLFLSFIMLRPTRPIYERAGKDRKLLLSLLKFVGHCCSISTLNSRWSYCGCSNTNTNRVNTNMSYKIAYILRVSTDQHHNYKSCVYIVWPCEHLV